jgi:hypothetical protein
VYVSIGVAVTLLDCAREELLESLAFGGQG